MEYNQQIGHRDPNKKSDHFAKGDHIICKYCHSIYQGKKWEPLKDMNATFVDEITKGVCPSCHLEKGHLSDGVLTLSGTFLEQHKDEVKHLIHNLGEKEEERDIMNRIERIDESEPQQMVIYTTKNSLAVEIGKKVNDSYKGGKLDIKFSKKDKPVEVHWHLDKE
jgi:NMD protein affecting ribosome stability and mRNA decay